MSNWIWEVSISLFNTITSFAVAEYFFSMFADKKKRNWIATGIAFLVFFLTPMLVSVPFLNMALLIACTFVIAYNYNLKFYNKILFTFLLIVLNVIIEVITAILITNVFSVTPETAESGIFYAFGALVSKFLIIVFCYILGTVKTKTLFGKFRKNWVSFYILPVSTFFVTYALYRSMHYYQDNDFLKNLSLLGLITLIISNLLILKMVNNIHNSIVSENRLLMAEELIKQQEKQYELLFENNDKVLKMRHDYKNFVIGLLSEINTKEYDKLSVRLNDELATLDSISSTAICGDSVIDTVVNYKKADAASRGITLNFEYRNVHNINISGIDISLLLGNAIDNAIEATEKIAEEAKRIVDIYLYNKGSQVMIKVINPVTENKSVDKLQTEKGQMHGYGIVNMKSIAAKYNGTVTFLCEDKVFTTVILLSNE